MTSSQIRQIHQQALRATHAVARECVITDLRTTDAARANTRKEA